ncbi:MAG: sodium:alanine symporter family protein [Rhodobacteraceae bacterium]|nr:sodium:alanine symporter family protein [Paracoccaceae bacterium]MDE2760666.1 sodium:alanine symporter family protein [Paracoccaceae bacterium]MDE2917323.1 sodium:alanine symporter family protein [Paracoccaceae bacterium]MYE36560.1 sodium:alanine symporter family protein [Paracoccaceae bacterium]MYG41975.1 sodium:alanine symporter family protein [Paracoccaceae bacterium]
MYQINSVIDTVNAFAWGPPMLGILGVTGVLLTLGLVFMPWRKVGYGFRLLFTKDDSEDGEGEVKPFNALMTALSATVGTGNIAGVATAIALGGPGAIFYMWLIALFGMATKYAEAVCAVTYREVDQEGKYVGGPMYYLRNGVGKFAPELGKSLGLLFAIFGAIAAFGIGNAVQVNSMAAVLDNSFSVPTFVTGIIVAGLAGIVIIGGIKRIGEVAGKLVPTMIVLYIGAALIVILLNITEVPAAIGLIFTHAFTPAAATGGFAGAAVAAAVRFGVARGVFSNESGLGSAAIAHAAAKTNNPVRQGIIAMLGTFIDTLIVCTMTALVILTSGAWIMEVDGAGLTGAVLTSTAFEISIPGGQYIVTIALAIFAFTTILGWSYYGERCWQYLFSEKSILIYRILWILAALTFANLKVDLVWNLADTLNGLMAVPNLIGLLLLAPMVFQKTRDYFEKEAAEKGKA